MKIIYYMPIFLKSLADESSNKNLIDFCELFKIVSPNACLIDRTDSLQTPFDIHQLYPIPTRPNVINYTYNDLCVDRAIDILKNNKDIVIFYSGGLDSTVVALSFWVAIQNGYGSFDQVTIAASPHSIIENPVFWEKYILPNFKLTSANQCLDNIKDKEKMADRYVMGENADQLFGSDILLSNFDLFDKSINSDNINNFLTKQKIQESSKDFIFNSVHNLVVNAPIELSTMADLIWWLNFSSKWQSVSLRTLCFTNFLDSIQYSSELNRFETFFNTPKFQILSMYGNLEKWGSKPSGKNYKMASRNFIRSHCDLTDYVDNKIKVPSLFRILTTATAVNYSALGIENDKLYKITNIDIKK